jgi:hypothetical protein
MNKLSEIERILVRDTSSASADDFKGLERFLNYYRKQSKFKYSIDFFQKDEKPLMVVNVQYGLSEGLLWMTNQRVFFASSIKEGFLKKPKPLYHQFQYPSIASIEYRKGGAFTVHKIIFHISTSSAHGKVAKTSYESFSDHNKEKFVLAVRERVGKLSRTSNSPLLEDNKTRNLVSELQELGQLKEQGLLTQDEFEQAKKKLLL